MREQGLNAQVLSGEALNTLEFWSITGDAGEGLLFTFAPDPRSKPEAKKIVDRFKAEGYDPEGYTLYTYATIQIWAEAAKKAGSLDADKMKAALPVGRASCRERGCQYGEISGVAGSVKKKKK